MLQSLKPSLLVAALAQDLEHSTPPAIPSAVLRRRCWRGLKLVSAGDLRSSQSTQGQERLSACAPAPASRGAMRQSRTVAVATTVKINGMHYQVSTNTEIGIFIYFISHPSFGNVPCGGPPTPSPGSHTGPQSFTA